jgi:predicted lipid carrier protein YhbT
MDEVVKLEEELREEVKKELDAKKLNIPVKNLPLQYIIFKSGRKLTLRKV